MRLEDRSYALKTNENPDDDAAHQTYEDLAAFTRVINGVDLPGGDPKEMYYTLTQRLSQLPDDMVLLPGHAYGGDQAPLGRVRRTNPSLQVRSLESFLRPR